MLPFSVVGIGGFPESDPLAIWLSIADIIFGKQVLKVIAAEFIDCPAWTLLAVIGEQTIDPMSEMIVKGFVYLAIIDES